MNSIAQAFAKVHPAAALLVAPIDPTNVWDEVSKFDPKARASINYAKARCAIEAAFPHRGERRRAKLVVIEHLHGTLIHPSEDGAKHPMPNFVLFADQSKARF